MQAWAELNLWSRHQSKSFIPVFVFKYQQTIPKIVSGLSSLGTPGPVFLELMSEWMNYQTAELAHGICACSCIWPFFHKKNPRCKLNDGWISFSCFCFRVLLLLLCTLAHCHTNCHGLMLLNTLLLLCWSQNVCGGKKACHNQITNHSCEWMLRLTAANLIPYPSKITLGAPIMS